MSRLADVVDRRHSAATLDFFDGRRCWNGARARFVAANADDPTPGVVARMHCTEALSRSTVATLRRHLTVMLVSPPRVARASVVVSCYRAPACHTHALDALLCLGRGARPRELKKVRALRQTHASCRRRCRSEVPCLLGFCTYYGDSGHHSRAGNACGSQLGCRYVGASGAEMLLSRSGLTIGNKSKRA
jgi:hypothetical protein